MMLQGHNLLYGLNTPGMRKKMASDKNHRPCLPLKPQEKMFEAIIIYSDNLINDYSLQDMHFPIGLLKRIRLERFI